MASNQDHIITALPTNRHLFYIDRREQELCVLIYPEVEEKSRSGGVYTKLLREALEQKGFRRGTLIRHRNEYREIEQWTIPIYGSHVGILLFVPGLCKLYGGTYVSPDPNDSLLRDCRGRSILKLEPGRYQLYMAEASG